MENVPRIVPDGLVASFRSDSWNVLPIFELIQKKGDVDPSEMYRVFNMGLGMVLVCSPSDVERIKYDIADALVVGEVVESKKLDYKVIID